MSDKTYAGCALYFAMTMVLAAASIVVGRFFGWQIGLASFLGVLGIFWTVVLLVAIKDMQEGDDE